MSAADRSFLPGAQVPAAEMARLLESFRRATGCAVFVLDSEGRPAEGLGKPRNPDICRAVGASAPAARRSCINERHRAGEQAYRLGEPFIFCCHAGLIAFSVPLLQGPRLLGSVVSEPMLMRTPTPPEARELAVRFLGGPRCSDESMHLLSKLPVRPEREVQALADLLFNVINCLISTQAMILSQQAEINQQQARIAEILQQGKKLERHGQGAARPYSSLERELLEMVKMGERKAARAILDNLLGRILFAGAAQDELTRAQLLELVMMLSRAAVEGGANLEEILGLKYQSILNLSRVNQPDQLCRWIIKIFDQLMDCIYQNRGISHNRVFIRVKEYIWKNHQRKLTLEEVAETAGLNRFYLSHLFRQELGITFTEYLNSVRVMASKILIENNSGNLLQIALAVGFSDSSYFCKVFRKFEGVSPGQYRKSCTPRRQQTAPAGLDKAAFPA
ncbi:MAG: PocR ligand-binding domain-containing protein [Candidatus Glassbacteria bacterium]|nr:PocR ligand-binding domain-containing protein [Candidatus Glassbacteria bacterium]